MTHTWSFSNSHLFRRCQRQWFFKTVWANALAKDPRRHEAYVLSKLRTVAAWRGSLVDHVVSRRVMPALLKGWSISQESILDYARTLFNDQFQFALAHRIREPGITPSEAGEAFAAFHAVEYETGVGEIEKAQAWKEVHLALSNLLEMSDFLKLLRTAEHLIPQRTLTFSHYGTTVRAVPDLIAFFNNRPPLIVDWKVHAYASQDYRLQLACYAISLTSCDAHRDFPLSLGLYKTTDIRLLEVQLLRAQHREYTLTDLDVADVSTFISQTAMQMALALGSGSHNQLTPFDLPATTRPDACQNCNFRSLCWEESKWQEWKQTSFL